MPRAAVPLAHAGAGAARVPAVTGSAAAGHPSGERAAGLGLGRVASICLLAVLPLALLVGAAVAAVHGGALGVDFRGELYPEASLVVHGHDPFPAPDADLSGGVERIFPIPAALLVGPLTALPAPAASAVWVALLLLALAATLHLLGVRDWRVYGLVALWPPTIAALQTGNLTIPLALAVALAWRWRERPLRSGLAAGVAIALKLFLWPLLVWLLARRRFSSAAIATATALAGTLLVLPFTSLASYARLMDNLARTFGPESYNPVGLLAQTGAATLGAARLAALAAGLPLLALAYRRRSLPLTLAAALLLSPIVWLHYFVLLAVSLALVRPRLAAPWALPLLLWPCPGTSGDVRWWHVAIALAVLAGATATAELAPAAGRRRGVGPRPARRPAPAA